MPNVAESFLRGHAQAQAELAQEQDQAEREIRKKILQQQLGHEKLQDLVQQYVLQSQGAEARAKATSGLPMAAYSPSDIQGGTLPSQGLGLGESPAVQAPTALTPIMGPTAPELGITEPTPYPRQTLEQTLAELRARKQATEAPVILPEGATALDPVTGQPIASSAPKQDDYQRFADAYAQSLGKPNYAALTPKEKIQTFTTFAQRGVDPVQHAAALALLQDRDEALKDKNAPVNIAPQIQTTYLAGGLQYLDESKYTKAEADRARKTAEAQGIPIVSKEVAQGLDAADRAALTLGSMWQQISPLLATDATGRLVKGPTNTLGKIFEANPVLGSFQAWRTAAVQAVQALAEKGMGLRLNQSEISNLLDGLPKITDTGPVAQSKMDIIVKQLENKVQIALTKNRSTMTPTAPGATASTGPQIGTRVGRFTVVGP